MTAPKKQTAEVATERSESLNVYQRLSIACSVIDGMPWVKDLSNAQYRSIPIDAMRAGVRKACIEAGLVHTGPDDLEIERERIERTTRYYATCTFSYINIDRPEERIIFESAGEAMDNGDKGTGKVISNLIKNHYKTLFDIGEQGKDDIDSYSNEELYDEAARIQNRAKAAEEAKSDRFYGKAQTPRPSADREPAQMRDTIAKLNNDPERPYCAPIMKRYREVYGLLSTWADEVIAKAYDDMVKACREHEGGAQ